MEKRLILAIALSVFIIFAFQYLFVKPLPRQDAARAVGEGSLPHASPKASDTVIETPRPSVEETEIAAETDRFALTFSDIGGSIKRIVLKDFNSPKSSDPLVLVDIKNPGEYLAAMTNPLMPAAPLDMLKYESEQRAGAISFSAKTDGLEITKEYILHNSKNIIELRVLVKNTNTAPIEFTYDIIGAAGISESNNQDKGFIEIATKINGKLVSTKRAKAGRITMPGIVEWTALKSKYFCVMLKPPAARAQFYGQNRDGGLFTGVESNPVTIQPGSFVEERFILFAGPSHIPALKDAGYGLEEVVNYGFFGVISKALLVVLRFFYRIFHSWGVAIILLAIFLNIVTFPLTSKSFRSMQKMQELHPQMEKLKVQYKDNPQKLNKEVMELYKKYKINPLGGCLPILLQMPIFISLYQALMKSIELRNTSFLWINDLSLPDAVKIPITMPVIGNSINILPIIMVIATVFQQKVSTRTMGSAVTNEQKEQQRMMLMLMPAMFLFIFYNMPSGIVIYWLINTILTLVEQLAFIRNTE